MGGRWRWLGTWWYLGAVGLLVLNDHVLKARYGTWWTGKLSDVVGVVVVAGLASVLWGPRVGLGATAVGFVALKSVPGVAEAAAPLLGGTTRRDPTDLIGLLVLVPMWRALAHTGNPPPSLRSAPSPGRWREAVAAALSAALPILGAVTAVVATTATSCSPPPGVYGLTLVDGVLHTDIHDEYGRGRSTPTTEPGADATTPATPSTSSPWISDYRGWAQSRDGGRTWTEGDGPPEGSPAVARDAVACLDGGPCVRASGDRIEEREPGGAWRTAFAFSDDQRAMRRDRAPQCGGTGDDLWRSAVVVPVRDGDDAGEEVVVVAAADDGVVVRGTDGEWERHAVLEVEPVDVGGSRGMVAGGRWALALSGPMAVLAVLVLGTVGRWPGRIVGVVVGLLAWVVAGAVWAVATLTRADPVGIATYTAAASVAVVGLPVASAATLRDRGPALLVILACVAAPVVALVLLTLVA